MDRDTLIRKIKACLRMAKSSNANEAATALRQAKALMDQAGLDEHDPELSGVNESTIGVDSMRPATWEALLIAIISDAFGCRRFFSASLDARTFKRKNGIKFVGLYHRAEVAGYTFSVLRRQCRRARAEYLKTLKRYGRKNKVQKADVFCLHWVHEVSEKIQAFALPEGEQEIVNTYLAEKYELEPLAIRRTKARSQDFGAAMAGANAARDVELNHGVGASEAAGLVGATLALGRN